MRTWLTVRRTSKSSGCSGRLKIERSGRGSAASPASTLDATWIRVPRGRRAAVRLATEVGSGVAGGTPERTALTVRALVRYTGTALAQRVVTSAP